MGGHTKYGRRRGALAIVGVLVAAAVTVAASPGTGSAAACATTWRSAVSGAWSAAADWTHGVPTTSTDACITIAGTYTVTVSHYGNAARSIRLGGSSGTQTLDLLGSCAEDTAILALQTDSVVGAHGALALNTSGCANGSFLLNSGTLTNNGTISMTNPGNIQAWPEFSADTVNNGEIDVDAVAYILDPLTNSGSINLADNAYAQTQGDVVNNGAINATGTGVLAMLQATYTQGSGTTTGAHPVEIREGAFNDIGTGKSTVTISSDEIPFTGNIARGQTVILDASCTNHSVGLGAAASWTNRGTVLLEADGSCNERARLETGGTLTNLGLIKVSRESAKPAACELDARVIKNSRAIEVSAGARLNGFETQLQNDKNGTLAVDIASATAYGILSFPANDLTSVKLGGTLAINTAADYWPTAGLSFPVIQGGKVVKAFAGVTGLTRTGQTVHYNVGYAKTGATLTTS